MMNPSIFIFLLIEIANASSHEWFINDENGLDPGRITWAMDNWYTAPIVPSGNHVSLSPFTLTFNFRADTSTDSTGVIQLICPLGLTCGTTSVSQVITGGEDSSVDFQDVSLSAGSFGPFGLITRDRSGGQIIDANYVFGHITILADISFDSLVVSSSDSSISNIVIGQSIDLSFSFTLTVDLWKYDVIVLDVAESGYTASSSPTCTSEDISGFDNLLLGSGGTTTLECTRDTDGNIEIYGLSVDVFSEGSYQVEIKVTGFTTPQTTTTSFAWEAMVYRFGTNTLIADYDGTSTPVTLTAGSISGISLSPYLTDSCTSDLYSGVTTFFSTSFSTTHEVPVDGIIEIVFSGGNPTGNFFSGAGNDDCLVSSHQNSDITCSIDTTTATITVANNAVAATSWSIVTRNVLISTELAISSITSKTGSTIIDLNDNIGTAFALTSETSQTIGTFEIQSNDGEFNSNPNTAGGGNIMFYLTDPGSSTDDLESGTVASFYIPFLVQSSQANKDLLIPVSGTDFHLNIDDTVTDGGNIDAVFSTLYSSGSKSLQITLSGEVDFDDDLNTAGNGTKMILQVSNGVVAPFVTSNLATFYQVCFVQKNVSPALSTVSTALLGITAQTGNNIVPDQACDDGTFYHPIIVKIKFTSNAPALATDNFTLLITSNQDQNLGISTDIPAYLKQGQVTVTTSGTTIYSITDFPDDLNNSSIWALYLPSAYVTDSSYTLDSTLQYPDSSFATVNNIFYTANTVTVAANANPTGTGVLSISSPAGSISPSSTDNYQFSFDGKSSASGQKEGVHLNIPSQVTLASTSTIQGSFTDIISLTSDHTDFAGNVLIATENAIGILATGVSATITVTEVTSGQDTNQSATFYMAAFSQDSDGITTGAACTGSGTISNSISASSFTAPTVTEPNCALRGPTNYDSTLIISLTVAVFIPESGTITIDILQFQQTATSECSSTVGTCGISSQQVTVTAGTGGIAAGALTVTLTGLNPPDSATVSTTVNLVNSVSSQTSTGTIQSAYSTPSGSCVISAQGVIGATTINDAKAYPNSAGAKADFYIDFNVDKDMPAGSAVEITLGSGIGALFSGQNGSQADDCWATQKYSACTVSGGTVTMTFAEDILAPTSIEVYFDDAVTLSSTSGPKSEVIEVIIKWHSVTISQTNPDESFTINAAPDSVTLTPDSSNPIVIQDSAAGENSDYTFTFAVNAELDETQYVWIKFPEAYDPFIGHVEEGLENCFDNYYEIGCESTELGTDIECFANHWSVIVTNIDSVSLDTSVSVIIEDIINPEAQTTDEFGVYILNSEDETVYAIEQIFGTVTITAIPDNLVVKNVDANNQMLGETGDFTFSFYTTQDLDSDITISVTFPRQFEIFLTEGTNDAICSIQYYDQSSTSSDETLSTSLGTSSCSISDNTFIYSISSSDTTLSGQITNRIALTIQSITNPNWGYTRTPVANDRVWDDESSTVFTEYDFWTDRFSLMLYKTTTGKTIEKSTDYLNSAYLGYNWPSERTVEVTDYDSRDESNFIEIYAGTQSEDISLNLNPSFPVVAEKLMLEANLNSNLPAQGVSFTSWMYEFTYYQWTEDMQFRVAASSDTSDGYYYIEWDITQTRGTEYDEDQYNIPARVLLEICKEGNQDIETATVGSLPETLFVGENTLPIMVSVSSAPASDYTLTFASSNSLVMMIPITITFGPDNQYGFFEIFVDQSFDYISGNTTDVTITITESGTDADVFAKPGDITLTTSMFDSEDSEALETPAEVTVAASIPGMNSGSVTVTGDADGIVYWYFGCQGASYSYDNLKSKIELEYGNFTEMTTGKSPYDYFMKYHYGNMTVPSEEADIIDFFWQRLHDDCTNHVMSANRVQSGVGVDVTFKGLHDGVTYDFGAYITNGLSTTTVGAVKTDSFETTDGGDLYDLILTLNFNVEETKGDEFVDLIAATLGINPLWIYNQQYAQVDADEDENPETTTFTWTILYSDTVSSYDSQSLIDTSVLNEQDGEVVSIVNDQEFTAADISWSSEQTTTSSSVPTFIDGPDISTDGTSFDIEGSLTTAGYVFVACYKEDDSTDLLSELQVLAGIGIDGMAAEWGHDLAEVNSDGDAYDFEIKLTGLDEDTDYECQFLVCNNDALWPTCENYESGTPTVKNESTDFAGYLSGGLVVLLALIFN